MKKNYFKTNLLILFLIGSTVVFSQNYTWMKGSNNAGPSGIYGTVGVASLLNTPGGREGATHWKDASGNFWLYGGAGYDSQGNFGYLSDLWKYDVLSNQWTWIKGDDTADEDPVFGSIGVPATNNNPGGRQSSAPWLDASGNLWLFGGSGIDANSNFGEMNDLWKYTISTNQWTWIKGSNIAMANGTYGTQGTASNANVPGARAYSASWADGTGNLWLFGGGGYDALSQNYGGLNDIWRYNITANQWTWIKGSNAIDQLGIYGTLGTAAIGNNPGSRGGVGNWKDASGNFWIMGGQGIDASSLNIDFLNDLWKYNPTTNEWTWMKGSNSNNQFGAYGTINVPSALNSPGSRGGAVSITDGSGNFYMFGGYGNDANTQDALNDLWKYDQSTNQWTWIKGNNVAGASGTYGTQGTAGVNNTPGGRYTAVGWSDNFGKLWIFGGLGNDANQNFDDLNDLWKFDGCVNNPTISIIVSTPTICLEQSVNITATGAASYLWSGGQITQTLAPIPTVTGTVVYSVTGTDALGCSGTGSVAVNVKPLPVIVITSSRSTICLGQTATLTAGGGSTYVWSNPPVTTSVSINVSPATTSTYSVLGTGPNGCSNTAIISQIVSPCTDIADQSINISQYRVYPNPGNGSFNLSAPHTDNAATLQVYNTLGQKVFEEVLKSENNFIETTLQTGVYHYNVLENGKKVSSGKLMIEQ